MAYTNGNFPDSALRPIAGNGRLEPNAARNWNAMAAFIYEVEGHKIAPNGVDSSYRSYERQVYWRNYWCGQGNCGNAAVPGTSNHGLGLAVDTDDAAYINEHGAQFGWQKQWSDAAHEWWHFKFAAGYASYDGPDPGPDYELTDPVAEKLKDKIAKAKKKREKKKRKVSRLKDGLKKLGKKVADWAKKLAGRE